MLGWTIFAYFADIGCDPLRGDVVDNSNQVNNHNSLNFGQAFIIQIRNDERSIPWIVVFHDDQFRESWSFTTVFHHSFVTPGELLNTEPTARKKLIYLN